jgi:glycosyltransferase involved in cell wall biosynthesis
MKNTRLVMLIARFTPVVGGTEKQALALAKQLQKDGLSVQVLTARLKGLPRTESVEGVAVRRLFSAGPGYLGSWSFMISSFFCLVANRNNYDLIQVFLAGSPALNAALAGKLLGKKVVLKLGGAGPTGDIGTSRVTGWGRYKLRRLKTGIAAYVVPTQEIKQELVSYGFPENKIQHLANGVDTDRFKPVSAGEKAECRRQLNLPYIKIITYAGRLEPGKGVEILLAAWEKVYREFPETHLLVLGEGRLREDLELLKENRDYGRSMHLLGLVKETEKYLQSSDLFVLPSQAEGLSNALLEAMACGLPVVASDLPGTREVVSTGVNGLLAKAADPEDLQENIRALLAAKIDGAALGAEARKTIISGYDIKLIARRYMTLYQTL